MHISEGILPPVLLAAGAAASAGGIALGLRAMDHERVPRVALLTSALFVASLIHVKVGPSSAHLVLNGLAGLILGWAIFPAFLVALLLQAVLFGFGGLTTLGVNTFDLALPGVVCYYLFGCAIRGSLPAVAGRQAHSSQLSAVSSQRLLTTHYSLLTAHCSLTAALYALGFAAGAAAILVSSLITAGVLLAAGKEWKTLGELLVLAHVPIMVIEGLLTGSVVVFLARVRPEVLGAGAMKEAAHV